jgi:hypothetical protein
MAAFRSTEFEPVEQGPPTELHALFRVVERTLMARRRTPPLGSLKPVRPSVVESRKKQAAIRNPAAKEDESRRRGQTLRLNTEAWKQLKILAVEQEKTSHELLIDAVNALFRQYGKPPVA